MRLTKLEIKGFKSFGDKVTIHFNEGVTAIVGPNGCGKSNVVDAIRWVLGEQSTRLLRSEKMDNLIFNGTNTRKHSNLAEVSLTFDNTKNILPTEFTQITLTRKLYRTGESEYRLNDVQCRLKDITDLFLDTGINTNSYSIIELKMIDEIIANKEGSRRILFEEAAGISKYKLRRKQTYSKLKDTESDLSRVEDLLFEIEKNLKTLEIQAKKAERYYQLKEQQKLLNISLATFRLNDLSHALEKLEDQEQNQVVQKSETNTKIDALEADLQQQKLNHITKEKNLSKQQKTTNAYTAQILTYESDKKVKNEQLRFIEEKKIKLGKDIEHDKNLLSYVHQHLKKLQEEFIQENKSLGDIKESLTKQQVEVENLQIKQKQEKIARDEIIQENNELQKQIYALEKEIAILNIQQEVLLQESKRNTSDTESRELALNEFNQSIAALESKLNDHQTAQQVLEKLESEIQLNILETKELIVKNKELLNTENRLLDAKQNEYNLTKSLVDNLEGFPESIRFLKKNSNWIKNVPLLSDIFFCKEEYRIPIENYLEPIMNHYVVESLEDAVQGIRLLNDSNKGRASFFILEAIEVEQAISNFPTAHNLIPSLQVIDVESKYRPLCEFLLQHVYLLQSDEEELKRSLPTEPIIILSQTGRFSKSKVGISGGSLGLFDGKRIGRVKNLEKLNKEIQTIKTNIDQLKTRIDEETQKLNLLQSTSKEQEIQQVQNDINHLLHELTSIKTRQEQHLVFIETSQIRKEEIEQKITSIKDQILQGEPQLDDLKAKKLLKSDLLTQKQHNYNQLTELLSSRSTSYNQDNIRFHQQLNRVSNIEKEIQQNSDKEQLLDSKIILNNKELEEIYINIQHLLQHTGHNDNDLIAMYAEKEELEKGLQELEQDYYTSRGLISDIEKGITQLRRNKEQTEWLINEVKDKKNTIKLDLNALKERLSIEFSIDILELMDKEVSLENNEEELREKINKVKRQLDEMGAINPMAMETYQEIKERHTFIQNQKKDLLDAKNSLTQTIKEIDDTAREKFMEAFRNTREHFIQVFRSLFNEEDRCDLILADPTNALESDIDILAKPKGKKPVSINQLSGGEKTLTATALLFSLYLLKPAPFCIFDEVDAPLDDTNIDKFNNIIHKFSDQSQFILISHNKRTIANTDIIYGVTMAEQGVSQVVAVDLRKVA